MLFSYVVWTGGTVPTQQDKQSPEFRKLRHNIYQEQIGMCGGLSLWACAGTSALERARIFWHHANYCAFATIRDAKRR